MGFGGGYGLLDGLCACFDLVELEQGLDTLMIPRLDATTGPWPVNGRPLRVSNGLGGRVWLSLSLNMNLSFGIITKGLSPIVGNSPAGSLSGFTLSSISPKKIAFRLAFFRTKALRSARLPKCL